MKTWQAVLLGAIVGPILFAMADVLFWIIGAGAVVWVAITYLEIKTEDEEEKLYHD